MKNYFYFLLIILIIQNTSFAQVKNVSELDQTCLNWYNKDFQLDNKMGVSVDKLYLKNLKGKEPNATIVVAVIDGGVDIGHEDLQGKIWVNQGEIPDNQIDDDNNGYIDDVYGWNFIGNASGENISYENMEFTRIVKQEGKDEQNYTKAKELFDDEVKKQEMIKENIEIFEKNYLKAKSIIKEETGIEVNSVDDLSRVSSLDKRVNYAKKYLKKKYSLGFREEGLKKIKNRNQEYLNYFLNKDFNPRNIVGDDPTNIQDKEYGNNDVIGPRSNHGTSVAGVIAAVRNNEKGIDGIASSVKIMVLRTTPMGDERDKDVALAIKYAVNNGADIINMSFGKQISPQKEFVDEAITLAEEKGVLIVHGAGNYGENSDIHENFPSDKYLDGTEATNWLNVGASAMLLDKKIVGVFSNYGVKHVDIFAPGVDVVSLDSLSTYSMNSGTSLAAPIVSGVAALILSYYPDLSPEELINILLESSTKIIKPKKVYVPGSFEKKRSKVKFSTLSKSGGIVNAYEAFIKVQRKK